MINKTADNNAHFIRLHFDDIIFSHDPMTITTYSGKDTPSQ